MEHRLATDEIKERAALYALGALSQIEAHAFENHLADGCEVCQAEVTQFDGVVGVLGLAAPPASPPAHLRGLLTARIAKEPRIIRAKEPSRTQAGEAVSGRIERRPRWTVVLPWAVAACLAVVAVSSVLSLRSVIRSTNRELAEMRLNVVQISETLAQVNQREGEHLQVIKLLEGPGAAHIFLAAHEGAPDPASNARIYWDKQVSKWLVAADMRPAPPGKVYQLWFLTPNPRSAGLIETDQSGHGFSQVDVPKDIGEITGAAMTLEPEGGSAQPTMPIYVSGSPAH
jgi:anti-sigma-K factor RskA